MAKLSARRVATAGPGRHLDGGGLMLVVKPSGSRSWILRHQIAGRRRDLGLGPYPEVSLARAREKAMEARRRARQCEDPLAAKMRSMSFRQAAEELVGAKRPEWRNAKHAAQWTNTLERYVYPEIGHLDVAEIEVEHVLRVLQPIWTTKTETASRVRQRIEAVLSYAKARKLRSGENPALWRGHLDSILPKPSKVAPVAHHAALDWRELPDFMAALREQASLGPRALAFAVLTAARSGEVREMTWGEVDLDAAVWTVPASRIKAGKEHRVPLVPETVDLLGEPGGPGDLVFESEVKPGRPLSDVALSAVLRRMGRGGLTVHGFRSTFRDWAGEETSHPREVIEAALAHKLKDKAEAAYARGDLFRKRRRLMADWACYLSNKPTVVQLRPAIG